MVHVRRTYAGRHDASGHHWENNGDILDVEDGLASRLLAEPAVPMYTLVDYGATVDTDDDKSAAKAPEKAKQESTPVTATAVASSPASK
jgi:hypothetical protein